MARTPTTPAQARRNIDAHVSACEAALRTLRKPLSSDHVCDCPEGNAAGITEAECGCLYTEAAKVLEAAGCYTRRAVNKGLLFTP